jgi:hypothetical protein
MQIFESLKKHVPSREVHRDGTPKNQGVEAAP